MRVTTKIIVITTITGSRKIFLLNSRLTKGKLNGPQLNGPGSSTYA